MNSKFRHELLLSTHASSCCEWTFEHIDLLGDQCLPGFFESFDPPLQAAEQIRIISHARGFVLYLINRVMREVVEGQCNEDLTLAARHYLDVYDALERYATDHLGSSADRGVDRQQSDDAGVLD